MADMVTINLTLKRDVWLDEIAYGIRPKTYLVQYLLTLPTII